MDKHGFELSFAWIFAIIVGTVIIVLAIYFATQFVDTSQTITNTETGAAFGTLLHPVETGLEESAYTRITFPQETRVHNRCVASVGNFGQQRLSTSVKSGIGETWAEPGIATTFYNKYVFSDEIEQGRVLHVFTKPLELPYKVGDITIISSKTWCFVNPPTDIEDELNDLNMSHVKVVDERLSCSASDEIVCFGNQNCDIFVDPVGKWVRHPDTTVYYEGPLVYAAIMSDPAIYECQVQRLGKRAAELAFLYAAKTEYLSGQGCSSNLGDDLRTYGSLVQIASSSSLPSVWNAAEELNRRNNALACTLF